MMEGILKENYYYIHEVLKEIGQDEKEIIYDINFNIMHNFNLKDNNFKEMIPYDKLDKVTNLMTFEKGGFHLVLVKDKDEQALYYFLSKKMPALNEKLLEQIEYNLFTVKETDRFKDVVQNIFNILNQQKEVNHPDEHTSTILKLLALPQDFIPSYMTLKVYEKDFEVIQANRRYSTWYDYNIDLEVFLGNYSSTISVDKGITVVDENKQNEEYDSIIDYLKEKNLDKDVQNDFDERYLFDEEQHLIDSTNAYTISFYEQINQQNYRYDDDESSEYVYEIDYLSDVIRYAVETLERIKNMDYDYNLIM